MPIVRYKTSAGEELGVGDMAYAVMGYGHSIWVGRVTGFNIEDGNVLDVEITSDAFPGAAMASEDNVFSNYQAAKERAIHLLNIEMEMLEKQIGHIRTIIGDFK